MLGHVVEAVFDVAEYYYLGFGTIGVAIFVSFYGENAHGWESI